MNKPFWQTFTCVKSLVTLILTCTFVFMCIVGRISDTDFMTVFIMIISFYFGSQWEKKKNESGDKHDV